MICRICHNSLDNQDYTVREMMFGLRHSFHYFQCAACECLQIASFPPDIENYYPRDYYSYQPVEIPARSAWKRFLVRQQTRLFLRGYNVKNPGFPEWASASWFKKTGIGPSTHILDVGCGQGELLIQLHQLGFKRLEGVDPFIAKDCNYKNGVTVHKKTLDELKGRYGFIMLNHSFEHMSDPVHCLKELRRLLDVNGLLLIRIPVVAYAWRKYKTNWVQLDAPRHYFLHSQKSMALVAQEAGFTIERVLYDSGPFQFYGSELYARDIALIGEDHPKFPHEELVYNVKMAHELNSRNDGDQASFFLKAGQL